MLNWVQIGGVCKLICDNCNTFSSKLSLNYMRLVNRSIILHKQVPIVQFLKYKLDFCIQDLNIRPSKVLMLCRLKIIVYNIATKPPAILKRCLDYNLYILICFISLHLILVPLLS
jgi:hypothetical protein